MKPEKYTLLALIIAIIIFVADLTIPLGVAFGVPYIIVVFIAVRISNRHAVALAAVICTLLVIVGYALSPEGGETWKVNFNRAIAIIAIWIVALIGIVKRLTDEGLLLKSKSLALMENIATVANKSTDSDETVGICMSMVCTYTGWPIGHYYSVVNDETRDLVATDIWHNKNPERFKAFCDVTEGTRFKPGIGLPGRVMSTGEPAWIVDVTKDDNFPRSEHAKNIGVRAGFAFPIKIENEVVGVLEFFSEDAVEPNVDELEIMSYVGVQFGRAIERKHAEEKLKESETKFRNIIEGSLQGIFVHKDFKPLFANQRCADIFGYNDPEEILKLDSILESFISPEEYERILDYKTRRLNEEPDIPVVYECQGIRKDGSTFWFENNVATIDWYGEKAILATVIDITDRKLAKEKIIESETKFRNLVEGSLQGIFVHREFKPLFANQQCADMFGFKNPEEILKLESIIEVFWSEEEQERIRGYNRRRISGGEAPPFYECHGKHQDGHQLWFENHVTKIDWQGEAAIQVTMVEITERKQADEKISYQASHDALTGLINRHEFERRGERLLTTIKEDKGEHAMCYLDLDQFKVVNDSCGHAAGDEMLRQLSTILQEAVRHRDTLARLGGDEFGVLMEHCSLDDAHRVATTLQKAVQDYQFTWEGKSFRVGVSIGLVPITETTANLTELLRDADSACYMAKDKGRNRIHVYHVEDVEIAQRHGEMQWVSRIQHALDEDRFCLYAQSIVPLDKSNDKHYELLIRMIDDKGEIIPPGAFLPAAERYNLMTKLDYWVIEKAFNLLAEHKIFQNQINFTSINLSGQSLAEKNFHTFVLNKLMHSNIQPEKICFEITETAIISNLNIAKLFIKKMKAIGCRFALDDFGSGLSSFGYLKNLDVDYLKIDGMFVKDIVDDPIDHAMVKSINEIGQVMGMKTIAEFVENEMIKGMLKEIGVNYAQGYGIDKPKPFDELLSRSNNVTAINKSMDEY